MTSPGPPVLPSQPTGGMQAALLETLLCVILVSNFLSGSICSVRPNAPSVKKKNTSVEQNETSGQED